MSTVPTYVTEVRSMKDESFLKVIIEIRDRSDYQYFLEMQKEYPKLRRFCEEFESQLRNWRKHDSKPSSLNILVEPDLSNALAHEIERWYYATKEEWTDD